MSKENDEVQKLANQIVDFDRKNASLKEKLVQRATQTNILAEAIIGSLGDEARSWKKEEAKQDIMRKIYDIKASNLTPENYENFMEIFSILVDNLEIDWRLTPFLMEKKRVQIAQNREYLWRTWANGNWNKICDDFDKTGSFKINLPFLGTIEPLAFDPQTGEPSKRITLHIPQRQNIGVVFSTSKEDHDFLTSFKTDLNKDPFKPFTVSPSEGASWSMNIYSTHQRAFEGISGWVRERLATQAKLYGGLPKYVFMETPNGKIILKGFGGDSFIPGYKITLTKEARRDFGEEIDDDTIQEIQGKHKQKEHSTDSEKLQDQEPNMESEETESSEIQQKSELIIVGTTDLSQLKTELEATTKPKGTLAKIKAHFS